VTKAQLLHSILDTDVQVGEVRLKLEDIISKADVRAIENDIEALEKETIANAEK